MPECSGHRRSWTWAVRQRRVRWAANATARLCGVVLSTVLAAGGSGGRRACDSTPRRRQRRGGGRAARPAVVHRGTLAGAAAAAELAAEVRCHFATGGPLLFVSIAAGDSRPVHVLPGWPVRGAAGVGPRARLLPVRLLGWQWSERPADIGVVLPGLLASVVWTCYLVAVISDT